jgi:hypothetical protein
VLLVVGRHRRYIWAFDDPSPSDKVILTPGFGGGQVVVK